VDRLVDWRIVPAIVEARRLVHPAIWQRIKRADFLCGVDPNFVGVSEYTVTVDGRTTDAGQHVTVGVEGKGYVRCLPGTRALDAV
jgi:hypothetical protein